MNKNTLGALFLISAVLISGAIIATTYAQTTVPAGSDQPAFGQLNQGQPGQFNQPGQPNQPPQQQGQQKPEDIQFPVKELGNCKSKEDCKVFCDSPKNSEACFAFAAQHNLMSSDELANAKKFKDVGMVGPGGCKGQAECDKYCGNADHMEECMTFAQKNGMMSPQQLQDSQKVLTAIKNGVKPPACGGPKQCDAYCGSPEHMEECMNFSLAAGLMPENQKAQMQKTLDALKQGVKPPACQPSRPNQNGQAGGPGEPNQPGQSDQMKPDQSSGLGNGLPPCDQYCGEDSHVEECVKFSVAVGNMTEQQAQISIKTRNKGPGGCVGKEACDTFCGNPDNQDTCFNFAKDNGMIPQADLRRMQEGQQKMKDAFSSIPPEVLDCLTSSVGADVVEKMKTGSVSGRNSGDAINQCFQKFGVQERGPGQNQPGQGGPGGQNQNDQGRQIQPWAGMCSNNTALACADETGKFVASAGVGSDGQPVCPMGSTAKCGNYQQDNQGGGAGQEQQNQQGQFGGPGQPGQSGQFDQGQPGQFNEGPNQPGQPGGNDGPNQGQGFNPGSGQNGNGPGRGQGDQQGGQPGQPNQQGQGGSSFGQFIRGLFGGGGQPNQPNQPSGQPGQPGQFNGGPNQPGQPGGGPNQGQGFNPGSGQNGNGPGFGRGGAPSQRGQLNQGQSGQPNQSGQGNTGGATGPCGTGPGTCSGLGPDDRNSNGPGGGPNQGQGFNPGSGQNGNGPGFGRSGMNGQSGQPGQFGGQPSQPGQFGQPGQSGGMQPGQFNQPSQMQFQQQQMQQFNGGQPGQLNQPSQFNPLNQPNPLNAINQSGQPGQFSPPDMQPQQQPQPQFQPPPQSSGQPQSPPPPPPPSSFLQSAQQFLANLLGMIR